MAMRFSTGLKNMLLNNTASGGLPLSQALTGGKLIVYDATYIPAGPDAALTVAAVPIITYTDTGDGLFSLDFSPAATAGTLSKASAQTWQGDAVASATGAWFRYIVSGDDGTDSATQVRIQGTVGGTPGSDLFLANPAYTNLSTYYIDAFAITIPDL